MEGLLRDLSYGLQALARRPGFTAAALLSLALGIGANSAIFSVVNAVLLRPLPYGDPEQLVMVLEASSGVEVPAAPANFLDWNEQNEVFEEMAAFCRANLSLTGLDEPMLVPTASVTPNLFRLLGVEAAVGRTFSVEANGAGEQYEVVLSHGFWQRQFGSDRGIIGKTLTLNGQVYTVVGVAPPELRFFRDPEMFVVGPQGLPKPPFAFFGDLRSLREVQYVWVLGRLKPGVSVAQAQAGMERVAQRLEEQYPVTNESWGAKVIPLRERIVGDIRPALLILSAAVGLVLLIACANVANLFLARIKVREREIALRVALGAGRGRLIRQLLSESVVLSFLGAGLGLLLAAWAIPVLARLKLDSLPRLDQVRIDGWVVCFTVLLSVLTGLLIGLGPALRASRNNLHGWLKEGSSKSTLGARLARLFSFLVVSEIAVALVLLVGAGLLVKSFLRLQAVDPGFNPSHVLTFRISLPDPKYSEEGPMVAFFQDVTQRIGRIPGVEAVGATAHLPLTGASASVAFEVEGLPPSEEKLRLDYQAVTPGYRRAMGIPLLEGRDFDDRDRPDQPGVVIVNHALAKRFWPRGGAIGRRILLGENAEGGNWLTVVGVMGDVRHHALNTAPTPAILLPYLQTPEVAMWYAVRTSRDPLGLVPEVKEQVLAVDPNLPIQDIGTFEQLFSKSTAEQRFASSLLTILAVIALILAIVGVYSVMSFSVSQRTHEMGIRMALGAQRVDVLRLVLGHGALLAVIGVGVGLVGAFSLTRALSRLLFEVGANDPWVFAGFALALVLVALTASYIPARRAMGLDPLSTLKSE